MASGWHRADRNSPATQARRAKYTSPEHRANADQVQRLAKAGLAVCWRCGTRRARRWHAGHSDDGTRFMGPECEPCNLKAAARKGALIANAKRKARRFARPIR